MTDSITDILQTVEIPQYDAPQTTREAFQRLGVTVLNAMSAAVALAITQLMKKLTQALVTSIENSAVIAELRAATSTMESVLKEYDNAKETISPYMKYLDLFPEVKRQVVLSLDTVDTVVGSIRAALEDIRRLTYANDILNSMCSELTHTISGLIQFKNFIDSLKT